MLGQEPDLNIVDNQCILGEVNTGLVAFQHVQSKQQIHTLALHDCERASQEQVPANTDLCTVDTSQNLGHTHTASNACKSLVDQSHDTTCLCTLRAHYGNNNKQ